MDWKTNYALTAWRILKAPFTKKNKDYEPPSRNNNNCGNCWQKKGSNAEWCPHCRIHNEYNND